MGLLYGKLMVGTFLVLSFSFAKAEDYIGDQEEDVPVPPRKEEALAQRMEAYENDTIHLFDVNKSPIQKESISDFWNTYEELHNKMEAYVLLSFQASAWKAQVEREDFGIEDEMPRLFFHVRPEDGVLGFSHGLYRKIEKKNFFPALILSSLSQVVFRDFDKDSFLPMGKPRPKSLTALELRAYRSRHEGRAKSMDETAFARWRSLREAELKSIWAPNASETQWEKKFFTPMSRACFLDMMRSLFLFHEKALALPRGDLEMVFLSPETRLVNDGPKTSYSTASILNGVSHVTSHFHGWPADQQPLNTAPYLHQTVYFTVMPGFVFRGKPHLLFHPVDVFFFSPK